MKIKPKVIIAWWSGGVTSAVACKLTLELFKSALVKIVFIDTKNEDPDTYRFLKDCEYWYKRKIESITAVGINREWDSIEDVWRHYNSLNVATGAICSTELKREVRESYEKVILFDHQVFGFDIDEPKRARSLRANYPKTNPLFPLLMYALSKKDCIDVLDKAGIEVPITYKYGFLNNNCFNTGCVQGGIGYWKKMKKEFPDKFNYMAGIEHELTARKQQPVTMLKDQSNHAKETKNQRVFLKRHPDYPSVKCIDDMKGRPVKPLFECNGFCGTNDLNRNPTEQEINFETDENNN